MLLRFKVENYKSFINSAELSLVPASKQRSLSYSILSEKVGNKKFRGLCSSVIYGPNASGKTNIIGALDVFRAIVLRGNIRNMEGQNSPNKALYNLELIPNCSNKKAVPVSFEIEFIERGIKYNYSLEMMIGLFLDSMFERYIKREKLVINDELVFERDSEVHLGDLKRIKNILPHLTTEDKKRTDYANQGLIKDELFLTNGFKLLVSQHIVKDIAEWFSKKCLVIYSANDIQLVSRYAGIKKDTVFVEGMIDAAAKMFGLNSNSLSYYVSEGEGEAKLCSTFIEENNVAKLVLAEMFESYGTIRLINMFPLVVQAITTGGTLIVDEFDSSIHPMAVMSIINIFHNDEINKKHAQLIFNTHNPIYLNSNILRKDEIKFVEKNEDTLNSEIYSLADFKDDKEVRRGSDYVKHYFIGRYGAIKTIDFSPIFERALAEVDESGK